MTAFQVNDMTCGHCVGAITKALKAVDEDAIVQIDLAAHRVEIDSRLAGVIELSDVIKEAGYTPTIIEGAAGQVGVGAAPKRSACCCSQG